MDNNPVGNDVLELYCVSDTVFKTNPEIQGVLQKISEKGYEVIFGFEVSPIENESLESGTSEPLEEVSVKRLGDRCRIRTVSHRKGHH